MSTGGPGPRDWPSRVRGSTLPPRPPRPRLHWTPRPESGFPICGAQTDHPLFCITLPPTVGSAPWGERHGGQTPAAAGGRRRPARYRGGSPAVVTPLGSELLREHGPPPPRSRGSTRPVAEGGGRELWTEASGRHPWPAFCGFLTAWRGLARTVKGPPEAGRFSLKRVGGEQEGTREDGRNGSGPPPLIRRAPTSPRQCSHW